MASSVQGDDEIVEADVAENKEEGEIKPNFCEQPKLLFLLVLFSIFWTTSSFNYYLITFFMKYIPGNIFVNTSVSCASEITANFISGLIVKGVGIKRAFVVSYVVAALGGLLLTFMFNEEKIMPVFVLLSKFGIACAFNTAYLTTPMVFPVILTSTAFGICNVVARLATVASPMIAELNFPTPTLAFSAFAILGIICSLCIPARNQDAPKKDQDGK